MIYTLINGGCSTDLHTANRIPDVPLIDLSLHFTALSLHRWFSETLIHNQFQSEIRSTGPEATIKPVVDRAEHQTGIYAKEETLDQSEQEAPHT